MSQHKFGLANASHSGLSFHGMRRRCCILRFAGSFSVVHFILFTFLFFTQSVCLGQFARESGGRGSYVTVSLTGIADSSARKVYYYFGVPFAKGTLQLTQGGSSRLAVGAKARQIFLLGMVESPDIHAWADPNDDSVRCFIGDRMGEIRLTYADGSTQDFPLISGESIWWGKPFYQDQGPFGTDPTFRKALASSLRLYPPEPVEDGNYIAVIDPKPVTLLNITIISSPAKKVTPIITGLTLVTGDRSRIAGGIAVSPKPFPPKFRRFMLNKPLRRVGENKRASKRQLHDLKMALYSSDKTFFKGQVNPETPPGYEGPKVAFRGNIYARVLANAFEFNVQDMRDKFDPDGVYHTSTKNALVWGIGGGQMGTYRENAGLYYNGSWSRDMGRTIQEMAELDYITTVDSSVCYAMRMENIWEQKDAPTVNGKHYPPHWGRVTNKLNSAPPYENDGHGLLTMALYDTWRRVSNRDNWLRTWWPDVKAAGDWIIWQFDHPGISGASDGLLSTTGESAHGKGYTVYADVVCMDALNALARMAGSIGQTQSARLWRSRAEMMHKAITAGYIVDDPKYGPVWTLKHAGWPNKSTVLGPLIFQADYQGFAPEDNDSLWRTVSEATYRRLIDTYKPLGFYGWAMGYGQGFVTQAALLLDNMQDATKMLDWTAKEIFDPRYGSFIVPEGVQLDPDGRFWYRAGDLGNGVQEAEIVKALRIVIGLDDTHPDRLQFYPRMPFGWHEMKVKDYPVLFERNGKTDTTHVYYRLVRTGGKMELRIVSTRNLGLVTMRLGPFGNKPEGSSVRVNGIVPDRTVVEESGDSWWIRFKFTVAPLHGRR